MPVESDDSSPSGSRDIFDRFLSNFDNCQLEVVSDVISGLAVQDFSMNVCANFGDCRLKPSEASFSAVLRR